MGLHGGALTDGDVVIDGGSVGTLKSHQIVQRGVSQVPEGRMVFANLSVEENLQIGAIGRREDGEHEAMERVLDLFPVLRKRLHDNGGWMSGGEQQMLAIGRAMMAAPSLMLLDEVSLGLAPLITRSIFESLAEIRRESGTSMLLVEQNASLALEFCDHGYILENGRVVHEGPAADLRGDPQVQELYLGGAPGESDRSFANAKRFRRRQRWVS